MVITELMDELVEHHQNGNPEQEWDDMPVMIRSADGGYTVLREDLVRVMEVDGETVVVIG